MTIYKDLPGYQSNKFLSGKSLASLPVAYTIKSSELQQFDGDDHSKVIVSFRECNEVLKLNTTQFAKLIEIYGYDSEQWIGKVVFLMGRELTSGKFQGRHTIDVLAPLPAGVEPMTEPVAEIPFAVPTTE